MYRAVLDLRKEITNKVEEFCRNKYGSNLCDLKIDYKTEIVKIFYFKDEICTGHSETCVEIKILELKKSLETEKEYTKPLLSFINFLKKKGEWEKQYNCIKPFFAGFIILKIVYNIIRC